tara:strand:- start:10 stop:411 length:402 start_codon:yes stop_codon:yes gene_type:complete
MAEKHIRSIAEWQRAYAQLEDQYERQQTIMAELQQGQKTAKKDQSAAIKTSIRRERERKADAEKQIKQAAALTAKATTAAATAVVGYYLVAEELDLWVVSEAFSRSEWFQAILTSLVAWMLAQVWSMMARRRG